jgi:hypothetical protein
VAALLFGLQAMAGPAVSLAHASEPDGGPVTLETQHTAQCGSLHDAARCASCQFDGTRVVPLVTRRTPWPGLMAHRLPRQPAAPGARTRIGSSAVHPRAPPLPLS